MKKELILVGMGAAAMYFFDPTHGGERRQRLLEAVNGSLPRTADAVNHKAEALGARAHDLAARADDAAAQVIEAHLPPSERG